MVEIKHSIESRVKESALPTEIQKRALELVEEAPDRVELCLAVQAYSVDRPDLFEAADIGAILEETLENPEIAQDDIEASFALLLAAMMESGVSPDSIVEQKIEGDPWGFLDEIFALAGFTEGEGEQNNPDGSLSSVVLADAHEATHEELDNTLA